MIPSGLLSSAILALAVVAEPAPPVHPALTFERAAQPGWAFVDAPLAAADATRASMAASFARESARTPATPFAASLGPDAARAVASWVSGSPPIGLPPIDLRAAVRRLDLGLGPITQLAVLIPLCLLLLARQRRFERRFDLLALPAHQPASRNLIRISR